MLKYDDRELDVLSEQVIDSDPVEMLREIRDWQAETKSDTVMYVLDSVSDIIINNTTWS